MSFIKSLFKSDKNKAFNKPSFPWKNLNDINQIDKLIQDSFKNTIVIFKHSTRCGVSQMVINKFEKKTTGLDDVSFYYLDLLKHRDISNTLAEKFDLTHQSPQLLLIKEGKLVASDSHYGLLQIAI